MDQRPESRRDGAPPIDGVLETPLYVGDLARARAFYEDLLGLRPMFADHRLCALDAGRRSVLLLFLRGASDTPIAMPDGVIPPHDGGGALHVAFAVDAAVMAAWEARLANARVAIESEVRWARGGRSIYFRDPDGHLLELATPGIWPTY